MDVEGEAQCFHPCMAGQAWCEVGVNIASSGFGELWKQTPPVRCQDAVEGGWGQKSFTLNRLNSFFINVAVYQSKMASTKLCVCVGGGDLKNMAVLPFY